MFAQDHGEDLINAYPRLLSNPPLPTEEIATAAPTIAPRRAAEIPSECLSRPEGEQRARATSVGRIASTIDGPRALRREKTACNRA